MPFSNPLLSRQVRPIRNWHEFLTLWRRATTKEEMIGLLHSGYDVSLERFGRDEPDYDGSDRLRFYLSVADGWTEEFLLRIPDERQSSFVRFDRRGYSSRVTPSLLRQEVAKKAFDVVALRFFKPFAQHDSSDERPHWNTLVASFSDVQRFFCLITPQDGAIRREWTLRNLHQPARWTPTELIAVGFLLTLARVMWKSRDVRVSLEHVIEENLLREFWTPVTRAKPWMIEVLECLEKLDTLLPHLHELDKPCIGKLEEIAKRSVLWQHEHPVASTRAAETIEEACLAGSAAGWLLKKMSITWAERERLAKIRDAECRRDMAEAEVKRLNQN